MELFEIDPELFVSCRLCLDEKGIYQIIPSVKDQIKYCFDINVEQYDGLPQLLCKKCKGVLSDFYETKKRYKEKQDKLIETKAPKVTNETKTEVEQQTYDKKDEIKKENKFSEIIKTKKRKKGKKRILSLSSSSSSDEFEPNVNGQESTVDIYRVSPKPFSHSNYQKLFVCRYCNLKCDSKQTFLLHKRCHEKLLSQCNFITQHCKVTLQTYDEKPSFAMQDNIVALHEDNFLQDNNSLDYYIIYTSNDAASEKETINVELAHQKQKLYECSDEEHSGKSIPRKRIRLVSPSSSRTSSTGAEETKQSAIEQNSGTNTRKRSESIRKTEDVTCINIDDTSTDASDKCSAASNETLNAQANENDKTVNQKAKVKTHTDYKTITNIISISYNKHLKKMEILNSGKEQQDKKKEMESDKLLNRKLLSIGRKVMSKAGLVSMSLLKHLQQRDLKIVWVPNRTQHSGGKQAYPVGKEADYIRIQTRIQNVEENNLSGFQIFNISNDDFECNNILSVPVLNLADPKGVVKRISIPVDKVPNLTCKRDPILGPIIEADAQTLDTLQRRNDEVIAPPTVTKSSETQENFTILTQLLNANPVANPKQVPRKKISLELNTEKTVSDKVQISKTIDHDYEAFICLDSDDEQPTTEPRLIMPIITSTTSLVEDVKTKEQSKPDEVPEKKNGTAVNTETQNNISTPRIKCKPVSELLAANTSLPVTNLQHSMVFIQDHNQQQSQTFSPLTLTLAPNAIVPLQMPSSIDNNVTALVQANSSEIANQIKPQNSNRSVTLLMHSPTLPNTLTTSPFLYIRQLMNFHKINFMEVNKKLSKDFICLIKFKLSVRQEIRSILLYLSLHGHDRDFCLKVRDKNNECINVETRPAFWEWEVLKAFQDDTVTSKTLDCAERIDSEFHKVTKLLLGLLKTVECKETK